MSFLEDITPEGSKAPIFRGPEPDRTGLETDIASEIREQRRVAFQAEADPLFFKQQRGEVSTEEWLAKVEEIRERLPYP